MLAWIHSLAALIALDFRWVKHAAFLHQNGVPNLSFPGALQVAALMICVHYEVEGKRHLVL